MASFCFDSNSCLPLRGLCMLPRVLWLRILQESPVQLASSALFGKWLSLTQEPFLILSVDRLVKPSVTPSSIVFYFTPISNMKTIVHPYPRCSARSMPLGPSLAEHCLPRPVRGPGITSFINLDGKKTHRRTLTKDGSSCSTLTRTFLASMCLLTRLL